MKNKIKEDTSITNTGSPTTSTLGNKKSLNINVNKKDLSDPTVQNNISKLKDANVNIIEQPTDIAKGLTYLSNIKDKTTGKISEPFNINGKKYQMVRALSPTKEKVTGVYSLDETDESGNNIIYSVDDFEKQIARPTKEAPVEEETPEQDASNFIGYKHFIVDKKKNKTRKFKTIEELAKANMGKDEQYMGIRDFKKFVDEMLFGGGRRQTVVAEDNLSNDTTTTPMEIKADKLMIMIKEKIPASILKTITSPVAKAEVILAFAEMIGVPDVQLNNIVTGIKAMAKKVTPSTTSSSTTISQTV